MGTNPYNSTDSNGKQDPNFNGTNNYGWQPVHDPTGGTGKPDFYSKVDLGDAKASEGLIPKTGPGDYPGGDLYAEGYDGSTAQNDIHMIMDAIERESEATLNTMAGLWDKFNQHLGETRNRIVQKTDALATGSGNWAGWSPTKSVAAETFMTNIGKGTFSLDEWITMGQQNADALRAVANQVVTSKKAMKTRYQKWVADHNSMAATVKADKEAVDKDNKPGVVGWLSRHTGISWADSNTFKNFERQMWEIDRDAARDLQNELKKVGSAYMQAWGATNEGSKYAGPTQAVNPMVAYTKRMTALAEQAMAAARAREQQMAAAQRRQIQQQQQEMRRRQQEMQRKIQQQQQQEQQKINQEKQQLQQQQQQMQRQIAQEKKLLQQQEQKILQQQKQLEQRIAQQTAAARQALEAQSALAAQRAAMQSRMAAAQRQVANEEASLSQRMNGLTGNINNRLAQLGENGLTGGSNGISPNMRGINGTPVNEMTEMGGAGRPNMSSLAGRNGMSGLRGMAGMGEEGGGGMGGRPMNPGMRGRGGMPGAEEGEEGSPGSRAPMGGRGDKKLGADGQPAAHTVSMPESEEHLGLDHLPTAPKLLAGRLDPEQVAQTEISAVRPTMSGRLGGPGGPGSPGGMRGPGMPGAPRGNRRLSPEELAGRRKKAFERAAEEDELMATPTLLVPDLTGRNGMPEIDWEQVREGGLGVDEEMLGARGKAAAPAPEVADPAARLARRRKDRASEEEKKKQELVASTSAAEDTATELWGVETPEVINAAPAPAEERDEVEERKKRGQVLGPS